MRRFFSLAILAVAVVSFFAFLPAQAGNPTKVNAAAPELSGGPWINTPNGKSLTLKNRRGQVTVVHFWTFACSNCRANIPIYNRWHKQFASQGVALIGVHTPELEHEKSEANVRREAKKLGIEWPVLLDGDGANWQRWHQEYWPTVYLIDKAGKIRYVWIGEMGDEGEKAMTRLIGQMNREKP